MGREDRSDPEEPGFFQNNPKHPLHLQPEFIDVLEPDLKRTQGSLERSSYLLQCRVTNCLCFYVENWGFVA
ncbi:hypothetical protein L1987_12620 [Smallanthus sonchifolius]|uniref:Uncharacterized protein n=1 Tax=Smallanthus sonchifolius TaxID=185202 RepID=A0ACB9JHR0_9ASTR|nr:hypothetical protein L1987_12620 [Smallanthus sonchifolius]